MKTNLDVAYSFYPVLPHKTTLQSGDKTMQWLSTTTLFSLWCSFLSKSDSSRKELVMPCFLAHYSNVPLGEGGGGDGRREAHCTSTVPRTNWTKQHSLMFCRAAYLMSPRGDFAFLKLLLIRMIILSLASIISPRKVTCISCLTGWPS